MHLSCFFTQNTSAIVNKMTNFKRFNLASSAVSNLPLQKTRAKSSEQAIAIFQATVRIFVQTVKFPPFISRK